METRELKGNLLMKKRQLTKLGFKVSVVSIDCTVWLIEDMMLQYISKNTIWQFQVPYRGYAKTSTKYKLDFLEKCLKDSSLNLQGRKEMALRHLKNQETNSANSLEEEMEKLILG